MDTYPTALVLGLAASGEAAARLLLAEGARVCVVDRKSDEALRRRASALEALGARVCLGQAELPAGPFAVGVVSPGIPESSDWVRAARERMPVISELELGASRAPGRILAVSGSNGKSTLVKLCLEALLCAGRRAAAGGNYGPPVSQLVRERRDWEWLVLEASSFQLETVRAFRPDVAVLLNMYPNHLDRHGDLETYRRLKSRLFSRMRPEDAGVLPAAEAVAVARLAASSNRWLTFGAAPEADACYAHGAVAHRPSGESVSLTGTLFANEVMGLTAAAAVAALGACGEPVAAVGQAAWKFQPLPHRMQALGARRQVRFVDDSKATNLAATLAALQMTPRPVRLIAGGLPKHESYAAARTPLAEKAAAVYLIGTAAEAMAAAWGDIVPCRLVRTLSAAVDAAWREAQPGDTILLSPGCASFDQFRDFSERGAQFAALIRTLAD